MPRPLARQRWGADELATAVAPADLPRARLMALLEPLDAQAARCAGRSPMCRPGNRRALDALDASARPGRGPAAEADRSAGC